MLKLLKKHKWMLGSFLVGCLAIAAAEPTVDLVSSVFPQWFQSGIYIGTGATNPVQSTSNKVVNMLATPYVNWDFPALAWSAQNAITLTCSETPTFTLTGASIGDECATSTNFGVDGGAAISAYADISCRTVTNGVVFKACIKPQTDAGALDLPDAGYRAFTRQ